MSTSVQVKLTNNQSGKSATNGIPVNGRQQTVAAVFSGSFPDNKVVVSVIEASQPGQTQGINLFTGPAEGPYHQIKGDGTPLKVNNGSPLDITNWVIGAVKV